MKQHEELIKTAKLVMEGKVKTGSLADIRISRELRGLLDGLVTALESQPFDVLHYMRDGGKVFSPSLNKAHPGSYYFWDAEAEGGVLFCNGNRDYVQCWAKIFIEITDWRPYHEPPVEFSVEWAVDQMENGNCVSCDGCAYNFHWVALPSGMLAEVCENGDQSRVLTQKQFLNLGCKSTWKIFVEPREPGWYAAKLRKGDCSGVFFWSGMFWFVSENLAKNQTACTILGDKDFHWIGSTRIELETPERES